MKQAALTGGAGEAGHEVDGCGRPGELGAGAGLRQRDAQVDGAGSGAAAARGGGREVQGDVGELQQLAAGARALKDKGHRPVLALHCKAGGLQLHVDLLQALVLVVEGQFGVRPLGRHCRRAGGTARGRCVRLCWRRRRRRCLRGCRLAAAASPVARHLGQHAGQHCNGGAAHQHTQEDQRALPADGPKGPAAPRWRGALWVAWRRCQRRQLGIHDCSRRWRKAITRPVVPTRARPTPEGSAQRARRRHPGGGAHTEPERRAPIVPMLPECLHGAVSAPRLAKAVRGLHPCLLQGGCSCPKALSARCQTRPAVPNRPDSQRAPHDRRRRRQPACSTMHRATGQWRQLPV